VESTDESESQDNYYFNTKGDGRVLGVFRLIARPNGIYELRWTDSGWEPYDDLIRRLISGDSDLDQVDVKIVRKITPYVNTGDYQN
jgi:hypothetical protein